MPVLGGRVLPAFMVAAFASTAVAQQKACDIDEGSPSQVARATLSLQMAQAGKPEDQLKKLQEAVKMLNDGDLKKNPTGRSLLLGRALVMELAQPSMASGMTTRGQAGFVDNPTAPYDLIAGIDSAFTVVETSNPECVSQTAPWRQQKAWVDLVNQSMQLSNEGKNDTAVVLAKRSLQLSKNAPYGYIVLAQAAAAANKPKDAIANYKLAIEAAKDTAQADAKRQLENSLGQYAADLYEQAAANSPDKATYMQEAKAAYEMLAKDPGTKYADAARAGQARIATMTGDTTAIKASYSEQLSNPGAFSYASLMGAAVTAAKANQTKDAIKLFQAAYAVNPYHRDVLYNIARLYLLDSSYAKGIDYARKLVAVDPSNPDNYQLLVIGYGSIKKGYDDKLHDYEAKSKALGQRANTSKGAALKAAIDSAAKLSPLIKAYTDSSKVAIDSALKYNDQMTKLPARVAFNEFTPAADKTTIGGTVTNQTDAARTFKFKIEFLDKSGNVVASQDVATESVAAHQSARFSVTGTGAGIVAFRYAPIS